MIQHQNFIMILIKLVIGCIHGKCLVTQILQPSTRSDFFKQVYQRGSSSHKFELYLDEKLNYNTHITEKLSKVCKGIGLLRKLSNKFPKQAVTIYKAFIRPHFDYGHIVYDKPNKEAFINKIEKAQYDAALAITGTIRRASREKLYAEPGLESLKFRQ